MRKITLIILLLFAPLCGADVTVRVEGVKAELLANVLAFLSINKIAQSKAAKDNTLSEFAITQAHGKATAEITEALQPYGYYAPTLTSQLESANNRWVATYVVTPGPQVSVTQVDILIDGEKASSPAAIKLINNSKVRVNKPLLHQEYARLKQALLRQAISNGYLDARFEKAQMRVSVESRQASIVLHLNRGKAYQYGDIELIQDAVDQSLANRFITIQKGDPFNSERLVAVQLALSDSGYFDNVEISPDRQSAVENQIPVTIRTQRKKSQRYNLRFGLGTDTGPRARLGVELRRLSGRGNKLRSDFQISPIKTTATAQYSVPIKNVSTDRQTYFGSFDRAEIGDTDSDLYTFGARRYDQWKGLRRQLYLEMENELFSIPGSDSERSELLILGTSLSYQRADDALFTRKGISARVDVHGSSDVLSETSFLQASISARAIYPLGKKGRLLLRGEFGINKVDQISSLPPSQRFFTGGDRSVRGYGYEELSPIDALGDSIGGQYLINGSVETDYFFKNKYGFAVFLDTGNAVNDLSDPLKSSVGIGFRYRTPVGVVRIDAAHPFDDETSNFRLHFSLGPDL